MMHFLKILILVLVPVCMAHAQERASPPEIYRNYIMPQVGVMNSRPTAQPLMIKNVDAAVEIRDQVAITTLTIHIANSSQSPQESEILVPVPEGAVIHGFDFLGQGDKPSAELLPAKKALQEYEAIVRRLRDPAILEFAGLNMIRSSVFPVPPGSEQAVRISYSEVLSKEHGQIAYSLPRSEVLSRSVPWKIAVSLQSRKPVATVYSPSHGIQSIRKGPGTFSIRLSSEEMEAGTFLLYCVPQEDQVTASLMACPEEKGNGGHFLLLAGIPPIEKPDSVIRREVTFVLDRSGSMSGEKFSQAREAARQVLESLRPDEYFNIVVFNDSVDALAEQPVVRSPENLERAREYLANLESGGGTNLYGAMQKSLQQPAESDLVHVVLFLTDGLPTVGNCSELSIRDLAKLQNPHKRRVFTFGVGYDVNTPLLDAIAMDTKACPVYVDPKENVEVKVASLFTKLKGPILVDPVLVVTDEKGSPDPSRVAEVMPAQLGDLYSDSQFVILGRYVDSSKPLHFRLKGNSPAGEKQFRFDFQLDKAHKKNHFVPRLWASRKVASIIDDVRRMGADPTIQEDDPRLRELSDSILALSTRYGILTEYTSFLATEGSDMTATEIRTLVNSNFYDRAIQTRSGKASGNQSLNSVAMQQQVVLNRDNGYNNLNMDWVEFDNVQQIGDLNIFRRDGQWVDQRAINTDNTLPKPDQVVQFGTPEYFALVRELAEHGRQGVISVNGNLLIRLNGKNVLISVSQPDVSQAVQQTAETSTP